MVDQPIPLATMGEVQEKKDGPTANHAAVGRDLLAMLILCGEPEVRATAHLPPQQQLRALIDILIDHRRLFTHLSDFMCRCDPDRLKPGEEQASDDDWKAMEAEVNAAIGGAPADAALPADVVRLVIAAREVAYGDADAENLKELDHAVEAFGERVPWDNEPTEADHG